MQIMPCVLVCFRGDSRWRRDPFTFVGVILKHIKWPARNALIYEIFKLSLFAYVLWDSRLSKPCR